MDITPLKALAGFAVILAVCGGGWYLMKRQSCVKSVRYNTSFPVGGVATSEFYTIDSATGAFSGFSGPRKFKTHDEAMKVCMAS